MSKRPTRRTAASQRRAQSAIAPVGTHLARPTTDGAGDVPDLLDALALATGERRALLRAITAAKKSGDTTEVTRCRRLLRNARDRANDARTKLLPVIGARALAEFEAALATDTRSLEMLPQSDGKARRRIVRGAVDAASYIRWHSIESPAACASVFAAYDRIALGRAYLDEAKRDLANESRAKVGSDLISAGERALARVLEVEATTTRRTPTLIETLLARTTETTGDTLTRPTAATGTSTTDPTNATHEGNAGDARGDATRIEGAPARSSGVAVGVPGQGLRAAPRAEGTHANISSTPETKAPCLESHVGSGVKLSKKGDRYLLADDPDDDEPKTASEIDANKDRVRIEPHVRVSEESTRKRVTTAPAQPSWLPRFCDTRKDYLARNEPDCACCHAKKK